ncbi:hypothetical protein OXPF_36470 [Oxobacter pfennigii]|uniref:DUF4275 domain-containing protein n=1 Tax=Oxobacter pfennigii TaxID=36849 RepID=A0A0P8W5H2_9CLOT|nr:DUF4275 family protein [Oxobacter pfennigii]KPU42879.1 hypothetical protein OXPF_36470 [Oxobacter pfennigii]
MSRIFSEIFWKEFFKEIERIDELEDNEEKEIRHQLLDEVTNKINDYSSHIFDYEYSQKRQKVIERSVVFVPQENLRMLKTRWSKLFAKSVDDQTKSKIHYSQFKWHIFSFKVISFLEKGEARKAFDQCQENTVYAFYQDRDEAFLIKNPSLLQSGDFDMESDIYIFDTIEKWTYIHTHEEQCGPYFYCVK